jgi:multiple sugar transport system ATP-binding protein
VLVNETSKDATDAYAAVVDIVEPMGSDSLIWLKLGNTLLSARVESNQHFEPGQKVEVRFRIGLASVFDEASGDRL